MTDTLAEKFRAARKRFGWTQQDVAHKLGITRVQYGKYERGVPPRLHTKAALCTVLRIDPNTFDPIDGEAMTDAEKALEIIRAIRDYVNEDESRSITFRQDWGGNSLTVEMSDRGHTHIGMDDDDAASENQLIDELYTQLAIGRGLSWYKDDKEGN